MRRFVEPDPRRERACRQLPEILLGEPAHLAVALLQSVQVAAAEDDIAAAGRKKAGGLSRNEGTSGTSTQAESDKGSADDHSDG